jgi:hypothetical protein
VIELPVPIALFVGFILLVVLGAAVRAARTARANGRPVRPEILIGSLLLLACATVWVVPAVVGNSGTKYPWQLATPVVGVSYTKIDPNGSEIRKVFDEAAARATTVIRINMNQWPEDGCMPPDGEWLAAPAIAYTPWAITITMRARPEFDASACRGWYDYWGQALDIHLSQPLNGRALFDGSGIPTAARPYP